MMRLPQTLQLVWTLSSFLLLFLCTTTSSLVDAGVIITDIVLVNADTDTDIRVLQNGDVLDIASLQSSITIRVNVDTTTNNNDNNSTVIKYVRLDWDDGTVLRFESTPPYMLGGNDESNYFGVAELKELGTHTFTVSAHGEGDVLLDRQELELETIDSRSITTTTTTTTPVVSDTTTGNNGGVIQNFILVDTVTNTDIEVIQDGYFLDITRFETSLSIRLEVDESVISVTSVQFNLDDGRIQRSDGSAPYLLGGDNGFGNYYAVSTIKNVGPHTISAIVYGPNNVILDERTIKIQTIESAISSTLSPTATPKDTYDVEPYPLFGNNNIAGELKKWHKITLGFAGRPTSEANSVANPFLNFRMDVNFTHAGTGKSYIVPGYYACDGDAANTGATSGTGWLVHFAPDEVGEWSYQVRFVTGPNVAVVSGGSWESADFFDGDTGTFNVEPTDKTGRDLRGKGLLRYVGKHHLQFAETGEYFLKAGPDSPENLLAYEDFDDTPNYRDLRKTFAPHVQDYVEGDPTWMEGKGKGLIGAINYLASKGANSISFLTMNIGGDDRNVFPYHDITNYREMDCSKLAQWEVVLEHATKMGMYLHFKTQEQENDQLLDGGELGIERKLYYRELIARFGHHLALNWNLGEENSNTPEQRKAFIDYITEIDPYGHPIVMHTWGGRERREEGYLPLLGDPNFAGPSLQSHWSNVFEETLYWVQRSAEANHPWVVSNDENANATFGVVPDSVDPSHDVIRKNVLWGNIMAGGAGVEYYFGYDFENSDLTLEDFRSRDRLWDMSRYALDFFNNNNVPFWDMSNANDIVSGNDDTWCLTKANGAALVVYLKNGGTATIDFSAWLHDSYSVEWYDPRNGGTFKQGSVTSIQMAGQSIQNIGTPPSEIGEDWVALVRCEGCKFPETSSPSDSMSDAPSSDQPSSDFPSSDAPSDDVSLPWTQRPMQVAKRVFRRIRSFILRLFGNRQGN